MEALGRALSSDDDDWRAVAAQDTPDTGKKKREWDTQSGSWKKVEVQEVRHVPDPTAFTAQIQTVDGPEEIEEPVEEVSFGFDTAEDELPESEPTEEAAPPQKGLLARLLAIIGF